MKLQLMQLTPNRALASLLHLLTLILIASLASIGIASSQQPSQPPTPTKPSVEAPQEKSKPADLTQEAYIFEKYLVKIHLEADGTGYREVTARIHVQSDAGVKNMAILSFNYTASNQTVTVDYVRVIKPDGKVIPTPDYNSQDLPAEVTRIAPMYSDIHQVHVAVKALGAGDILEYKVTLRIIKPDVPGSYWQVYNFEKNAIVLDEQLDLDIPADMNMHVVSSDVQPTLNTVNKRKLYHWASSTTTKPDPDAPPKPKKELKPSVQISTFNTWEEVGAWYGKLARERVQVTPAIQARADADTKGLKTQSDKLKAIFNDVALHIHYISLSFGIGRYQPHEADDVLSNEYGDCKDKHTLLAAMLKAVGIEAWPVLISSSQQIDPATPSPAQFDHVITIVSLDGKLLWMDSTEEVAPIGLLMPILRDKQALAIPTDKPAYLERTPIDPPFLQTEHFTVVGSLTETGEFNAKVQQNYHGDLELALRSAFRQVAKSDWKELAQRLSQYAGFAGDVSNVSVSDIEKINEPLDISYDYKREQYGEWERKRITAPMPPVGLELSPGQKTIKPIEDQELGSPGEKLYIGKVKLPEGWHADPPSNVHLVEDWAEYHSTYSFEKGIFTGERRLVVKKNKIPLAQWDKFLAFRRAINEDESNMTSLSSSISIPITKSSPSNMYQFEGQAAFILPSNPRDRIIVTKMLDTVGPISQAINLLESDPAADSEELKNAINISTKACTTLDEITQSLNPSEMNSMYWTQILNYAWSARGWAALNANDLKTAELYLKASWQLGHDRTTGYLYGKLLTSQGKNLEARHIFELAHISDVRNPLNNSLGSSYDVDEKISTLYRQLANHPLDATPLNHGEYNGSLRAELDKMQEIHQLTKTSHVNGIGFFSISYENNKAHVVHFLGGDTALQSLTPMLAVHAIPFLLPSDSHAVVLRELRISCTEYAGCDLKMLLPTAVISPGQALPMRPFLSKPKTQHAHN